MPKITEKEIQELKKISILEYARSELNEPITKWGNQYRIGESSIIVSPTKNLWNKFSDDTAGGDIFSFVMYWEKCSFREAIDKLRSGTKEYIKVKEHSHTKTAPTASSSALELPLFDKDVKNIYAFLIKERKIDVQIVREWIKRGYLYQSANHKECVFVGTFKDKIEYATKVATKKNEQGKFGKYDVAGSVKEIGLFWKNTQSDKVQVFESAIDCMAYQSLRLTYGEPLEVVLKDTNYLVCGGAGVSANTLYFNMVHYGANIKEITMSLDNDKVGIQNMELCLNMIKYGIRKGIPKEQVQDVFKNIVSANSLYSKEKDWNDELKNFLNTKESTLETIRLKNSISTKEVSQDKLARFEIEIA